MKKFFWFLLLIVLFPLMPFPIIAGLVIYSFIKKQKQPGNPWFQSLQTSLERYTDVNWQKSFSTSWSWPQKPQPHTLEPATTHYHKPHITHRHKKPHTSDQELRLRLAIISVGIILVALIFAFK